MKSITDRILDAAPNGILSRLFEWGRRFGLLALAVVGLALFALCPALRANLRFFHIACILVSTLVGRSFLREEDVRGWLWQNVALFAHALLLVINGLAVA